MEFLNKEKAVMIIILLMGMDVALFAKFKSILDINVIVF